MFINFSDIGNKGKNAIQIEFINFDQSLHARGFYAIQTLLQMGLLWVYNVQQRHAYRHWNCFFSSPSSKSGSQNIA